VISPESGAISSLLKQYSGLLSADAGIRRFWRLVALILALVSRSGRAFGLPPFLAFSRTARGLAFRAPTAEEAKGLADQSASAWSSIMASP